MSRRWALLGLLLSVLAAPPAWAGDVTAFVAWPQPSQNWARGYGATLSSTWFSLLALEGEAARLPGSDPAVTMTSFTASALLAPPIGFLTPYGGLGIGVFRQADANQSDTGTLRALVLGLKVKIGPLFVLKGEFRNLGLSGTPLLTSKNRYSVGAGISF
jgi:hypothetical protein